MISRMVLALMLTAALIVTTAPLLAQDGSPTPEKKLVSTPPTVEGQPSAPAAAEEAGATKTDENASGKTDADKAKEGEEQAKKPRSLKDEWMLPAVMVGGIVLMYVWMGRGRKKREAQRKEMLAGLKKGDKVTSIGGIVGIVVEVRDSEVVMKIDENNNIRMRLARWAIRGTGEQAKTEAPEDK